MIESVSWIARYGINHSFGYIQSELKPIAWLNEKMRCSLFNLESPKLQLEALAEIKINNRIALEAELKEIN